MSDFTPINSQEELDRVLSARLQRERETVTKQYQSQITERDQKIAEYDGKITELNKKIEGYSEQAGKIADLQSKIKGYETNSVKMRIAHEIGLPYELADRLSGETEDDIRKDAESVKKLIGAQQLVSPLATTESGAKSTGGDSALKSLLTAIRT